MTDLLIKRMNEQKGIPYPRLLEGWEDSRASRYMQEAAKPFILRQVLLNATEEQEKMISKRIECAKLRVKNEKNALMKDKSYKDKISKKIE